MSPRKSLLLGLLATAMPAPLLAQQPEPPADEVEAAAVGAPAEAEPDMLDEDELEEDDEVEEIVVTGSRRAERGAVIGDIEPEVQLNGREVRALGASNLGELLDALAPQTRSGRGRGEGGPVVLLNGRRISSFREIRNIPPEAIQRVDILPEEVALKYGYRADQRVVNFVTRRRFRAITAELDQRFATAGGRTSSGADVNVLRINRNGRWSLDAEIQHDTPLFESERDLIQAPGGTFDRLGNITSPAGGEIDPALSALLGQSVTIAGVPASAGTAAPTLGAFTAGANVTDLGRFRTLLAGRDQFELNGTINRTILNDVSATLNASIEGTQSKSRFGLPTATLLLPADNPFSPFGSDVVLSRYLEAPGPLTRESDNLTGHIGIALNGDVAPWRWSFTSNYDQVRNESRTQTGIDIDAVQEALDAGNPDVNPFGSLAGDLIARELPDRSRSTARTLDAEFVANGPLFDLPAGDVSTTVRTGFQARGLDSETFRGGLEQSRGLSRNRANIQANVDVPIASRRRDVLAAIGDLSANFNAEVEHLSDFGTLRTLGAGLNWSPIEEIDILASFTDEDGAPSIQQLGDPLVPTPNVRVFDFLRGETVEITRLEGGNAALLADNRRVFKLGATVKPLDETDLSVTANYISSRMRNLIASFPTATPEIEAAFPERFLRDADGRLLRIDSRPVNFTRADREELRWGVNFSKTLGPTPSPEEIERRREERRSRRAEAAAGAGETPAEGTAAPTTPEAAQEALRDARRGARGGGRGGGGGGRWGGGGGGRGFGGGGFGGGGFGGGGRAARLQLAFYHTWRFKDEIRIREGVPVLDLLNGSAAGNNGGHPSHELEFQASLFKSGFGARLTANWQEGTFVRGGPTRAGDTSSDLFFSDLATVNLRLFADLGQQRSLVTKYPWLRGTRVTVAFDNLFDARLRVRDSAGTTPLGYQPDYLDPLGRSVRISLRKLFF